MTTLVVQLYVIDLKMIQFVRNQKFQTKSRIVTAIKSEDFDTEKVKKNLFITLKEIYGTLKNTYDIISLKCPRMKSLTEMIPWSVADYPSSWP